jgi:GNAT superfamily N-acetyltransferase
MIIRQAGRADVPVLADMGQKFVRATEYLDRVANDPAHFRSLAETVINQGRVFVAEVDGEVVGMLGALMITHPVLNERMGAEVIWWVDPAHRRGGTGAALFRAAEAWARSEGGVKMQFSAYRDRVLERLYRRLGYEAKEVIFEKELCDVEASLADVG